MAHLRSAHELLQQRERGPLCRAWPGAAEARSAVQFMLGIARASAAHPSVTTRLQRWVRAIVWHTLELVCSGSASKQARRAF